MGKVIAEVISWATGLPYWEKFLLSVLVEVGELEEEHYETALEYLLEDSGLSKKEAAPPPIAVFDESESTQDEADSVVRLRFLKDLANINALVGGQQLTFGDHLTAIYGGTGSGKSGYARVLGCAGFTRGDKEVLPNLTKVGAESSAQTAKIGVEDSGGLTEIDYVPGSRCVNSGSTMCSTVLV